MSFMTLDDDERVIVDTAAAFARSGVPLSEISRPGNTANKCEVCRWPDFSNSGRSLVHSIN